MKQEQQAIQTGGISRRDFFKWGCMVGADIALGGVLTRRLINSLNQTNKSPILAGEINPNLLIPPIPEGENPFSQIDFGITSHHLDSLETAVPEFQRQIYQQAKEKGISRLRVDFRWALIQREEGTLKLEQWGRYLDSLDLMEETGLEPPVIILSTPPEWASELYNKDKEGFFEAFWRYASFLKNALEYRGKKVDTIQIMNELNHPFYNKIKPEDIATLCEITRDVFAPYNPDLDLLVTVFVANLNKRETAIQIAEFLAEATPGVGLVEAAIDHYVDILPEDPEKYLDQILPLLDKDVQIGLDYYPGFWHFPIIDSKFDIKRMIENMDLLRKVAGKVAKTGRKYKITEIGYPSKGIFPNIDFWEGVTWNQEKQRYALANSLAALKRDVLYDLYQKGLPLPEDLMIYLLLDEPHPLGKIVELTPFAINTMGMIEKDGKPKEAFEDLPGPSTKEIVSYLKSPSLVTPSDWRW